MAKNKLNGKDSFEQYYFSLYNERWSSLKESFTTEPLYATFQINDCSPYYLDAASVFASNCLPLKEDSQILDMCAARLVCCGWWAALGVIQFSILWMLRGLGRSRAGGARCWALVAAPRGARGLSARRSLGCIGGVRGARSSLACRLWRAWRSCRACRVRLRWSRHLLGPSCRAGDGSICH